MSFKQNWIDSTVHCVDVAALNSNPSTISANTAVIFTASIKSSDTMADPNSGASLDPGDGGTAIDADTVTGPVNGIYTATFPSYTYTNSGVYQAVINTTTDEPQTYEQQFQVVVN